MDESANKLSKRRRRRRILMHSDDEDDGTPRKIQNLIQSEPTFTTFNEIERSSQTERTFSSFSSLEHGETSSISRRTTSSEFENSSFSTSSHADKQETSYQSFSKSEASETKVESYSDITKTESTYRSYSKTDQSSTVHESYSASGELQDTLAGLRSIDENKSTLGYPGGAEGTDHSRPRLGQIGKSEHTSRSLGSFHDFGKITRDDRDIFIDDTGKSRTYHDISIKEGHSKTSDKDSSEHRRFKTDSEKYSYSDNDNTRENYTRSEQHEVTERQGFIAPEVMSTLHGNHHDNAKEGRHIQHSLFYDPDGLESHAGKRETYTNIDDLLGKRQKLSRESNEETKFTILHDVQSGDTEEDSGINVTSIRDRVGLMRASMANKFEEPENVQTAHDIEAVTDIRFSSESATEDPLHEDQPSIVHEEQSLEMRNQPPKTRLTYTKEKRESRKADNRDLPSNEPDQTEARQPEIQLEKERNRDDTTSTDGIQSVNTDIAQDLAKQDQNDVSQFEQGPRIYEDESVKKDRTTNSTDTRSFELLMDQNENNYGRGHFYTVQGEVSPTETSYSLEEPDSNEKTSEESPEGGVGREAEPYQTSIVDELIQQDRAIVVHAETSTDYDFFIEQDPGNLTKGIQLVETDTVHTLKDQEGIEKYTTDGVSSVKTDGKIEIVQQDENQKSVPFALKIQPMETDSSEEALVEDQDTFSGEQLSDTSIPDKVEEIMVAETKNKDELKHFELEIPHEKPTISTDTEDDLTEKERSLQTNRIQFIESEILITETTTTKSKDETEAMEAETEHEKPAMEINGDSDLAEQEKAQLVQTDNVVDMMAPELDDKVNSMNLNVQNEMQAIHIDSENNLIEQNIVNTVNETEPMEYGIAWENIEQIEPEQEEANIQQDDHREQTQPHSTFNLVERGDIKGENITLERYQLVQNENEPSTLETDIVGIGANPPIFNAGSDLLGRKSNTGNVSEEIITIQTGIVVETSELTTDLARLNKSRIPPKRVGSDEVIIIHGLPINDTGTRHKIRSSYETRLQKSDTKAGEEKKPYDSQLFEVERHEVQTYESRTHNIQLQDVIATPSNEQQQYPEHQQGKLVENHPYETPPYEAEQYQIRSTEIPFSKSSRDAQKLNLRSYAPRPYQKPKHETQQYHVKPRVKQPFKKSSFKIQPRQGRSYDFEPRDVQTQRELEDVRQPYSTPPREEEPEQLKMYGPQPTEVKPQDVKHDVTPEDNSGPTEPCDVERREVRLYSHESRPYDVQKPGLESFETQPNEVQPQDEQQDMAPEDNLHHAAEPYNVEQLQVTGTYESRPYDVQQPEYETQPTKVQPQGEQHHITPEDNFHHTESLDEERRELRSYERKSYELSSYDIQQPELQPFETYSTEEQPQDEQRDMAPEDNLHHAEPYVGQLQVTETSYESRPYDVQQPESFETQPTKVQPQDEQHDIPPDDNFHHTESLDEERRELRSYERKSYESRPYDEQPELQPFETHPAEEQPQDGQHDMTLEDNFQHAEPYNVEQLEVTETSYASRPYDVQQPELKYNETQRTEEQPEDEQHDMAPEENFHHIETYNVERRGEVRSFETSNESRPKVQPEDEQHDMTPEDNFQYAEPYNVEQLEVTETSYESRPYDVQQPELKYNETQPTEEQPEDEQHDMAPEENFHHIETYNVERRGEVRSFETSNESRPKVQPEDEQDITSEENLHDTEPYDLHTRNVGSYGTTSYVSRPYDVQQPESFETRHTEVQSQDEQHDMAAEDNFQYTEPYNVEQLEVRSFETTSYESPEDNLHHTDPSDEERPEVSSYETKSHELRPYYEQRPELQSFLTQPTKVQPQDEHDMAPEDNFHHTEPYNVERRELRSYATTSYELRLNDDVQQPELQPHGTQATEVKPQDEQHDIAPEENFHHTEPYNVERRELRSYETTSYESRPYDVQQPELQTFESQPTEVQLDKFKSYDVEEHEIRSVGTHLKEEKDIKPEQQEPHSTRPNFMPPMEYKSPSHEVKPRDLQPEDISQSFEEQEHEMKSEDSSDEEQLDATYDVRPREIPLDKSHGYVERPMIGIQVTHKASSNEIQPMEPEQTEPYQHEQDEVRQSWPRPQLLEEMHLHKIDPLEFQPYEESPFKLEMQEYETKQEDRESEDQKYRDDTSLPSKLKTSKPMKPEPMKADQTERELYQHRQDELHHDWSRAQLLQEVHLHKFDPLEFQPHKASPINERTLEMQEYETDQGDRESEEKKEIPDEKETDEATLYYIEPSNFQVSDITSLETVLHPTSEDLQQQAQPMDTGLINQPSPSSSDVPRYEAVTIEKKTVRELYASTEYKVREFDTSFPSVQRERISLEDGRPEPVYPAAPIEKDLFETYEQILVLDDLPEKKNQNDEPYPKEIEVNTEDDFLHYTKYTTMETDETEQQEQSPIGHIDKDSAMEVEQDNEDGSIMDQYTPGKYVPTTQKDSDVYFHQSNTPVDSFPDSPAQTTKRKLPNSYELPEDDEMGLSSVQHVAIKRKVTISKSLPTAGTRDRKERSKYTHKTTYTSSTKDKENVPLTSSVNKSSTNQVVENISSSTRNVLESSQEQVDHVFNLMENQGTDNKEQLPQQSPPRSVEDFRSARGTEVHTFPKYRVDCHIQLSPVENQESKRPLKSWKSEPLLKVDRPQARRSKSMNLEKTIPKQSSHVAIELKKPHRHPLAPAYSIDNLPFETIIRNEVNIKMKKKRKKTYVSGNIKDDDLHDEPDGPLTRDIQAREIQTEQIERQDVQLSESFETIDSFYADQFNDELEENNDYNKENEPEDEVSVDSWAPSLLRNIERTPADQRKARKSRLNVTPITIRPKTFKEEPTHVVVKQQQTSDITYGRIETAPTYKLNRAVTSEKPRDDIIIEETSSEGQSSGFPKPQPREDELSKKHGEENISDLSRTNDLHIGTVKDKTRDNEDVENKFETVVNQHQEQPSESIHDPSELPTFNQSTAYEKPIKKSTKRRHRILVDREVLQSIKNDDLPILTAMETSTLENEPNGLNENSEIVKDDMDIGRYLESHSNNNVPQDRFKRYLFNYPNKTGSYAEEPDETKEAQTFSQYSENFKELLENENEEFCSDTTDGLLTKRESLSPINIQKYLGDMIEEKAEEEPGVDETESVDSCKPYEANKEIQMLLEKVSDDEEEPVTPLVRRQAIQVILVDETKKKKKKQKKKSKKKQDPNVATTFDDTQVDVPIATEATRLKEPDTVKTKQVPEKKERVDTKEIAVQTMFVPDDIDVDSEDDSDQEILQYQPRSAIGGYLINTIPEEREDEIPVSTPYQNKFTSPIDEEQIRQDTGLLFRDTHDHEPTPRHSHERTDKPNFSNVSIHFNKPYLEPTIEHEASPVGLSPYMGHDQSPQRTEEFETPKRQAHEHKKDGSKTTSHTRITKPTETWQNESPYDEQHDMHLYIPEDDNVGFEFDTSSEKIETFPGTATDEYKFSKTIYKPRFEIQDFVVESERRRNDAQIQAPPNKKHKMSSPHSPIDNTLLENDQYQKEETIPVPLLEPVQPTGSKNLVLVEDTEDVVDGQKDTRPANQPKYKTNEAKAKVDSAKATTSNKTNDGSAKREEEEPTHPDYQPRYEIRGFIHEQQPKFTRFSEEPLQSSEHPAEKAESEAIPPKHEQRFEEKAPTIPVVKDKPEQSYFVNIAPRDSVLAKQPRSNSLRIESLSDGERVAIPLAEEVPERQLMYAMQGFVRDDHPERKPISLDARETNSIDFMEDQKPSLYQPRHEINNFVLEEEPDSTFKANESTQIQNEPESLRPSNQLKYEIHDFVLQEYPASTNEEKQPVSDERVNTATIPLVQEEPDITHSRYQSGYKSNDLVLEDQSQSKPVRFENRITTTASSVEEKEPTHVLPAYQPSYEIRDFVFEEQPEKSKKLDLTDDTMEDISETSRFLYRPKIKVNDFVADEKPRYPSPDNRNNGSSVSTSKEHQRPNRLFNEPKYDIKDFVLVEEPETKNRLLEPVLDETVETTTVTLVEVEPGHNKQRYQPRHEIKDFVLEENREGKTNEIESSPYVGTGEADEYRLERLVPLELVNHSEHEIRDLAKEKTKKQREKPPEFEVDTSPFVRETQIPIPVAHQTDEQNFVEEELPQNHQKPKYPIILGENINAAAVYLVEEEPDLNYTVLQPREIKDFVIEETEPERNERTEGPPFDENVKVTDVNNLQEEPEITRSLHQPKYEINDFEFDELPKSKDLPRFYEINETMKAATVPTVQEEPQPNYTVLQSKKIRHFVIEEEPERNDRTQGSPFDENVNVTDANNLMEEPEITRSLHQPKYEINDLEFEEQQERGYIPRFSEIDENMKAATVPFVQEEPRPDYTDLQPRKIKDFVIEGEPERNGIAQKHPIKENVKASAVNNVQEEPEITRSLHQPKYEINDLEFDEQPKSKDLPRFSETNETIKAANVPMVQKEPEPNYTVLQPKKIRHFVIEEEPERNDRTQGSPFDENVNVTAVNNLMEEPEITRSLHEPKYEINYLEFDEQQERGDLPRFSEIDENMKAATVPFVQEEPRPDYTVLQPRKIDDFVIEEEPERNGIARKHPIKENVKTSAVNNVQEEPEITRSLHPPKYEINDLEFEEQQERGDLPRFSEIDENMKAATVPFVQEESRPDYTVLQPRKIKDFVIEEEPERNGIAQKHLIKENVKASAVNNVQEEPEITRSLHQPKYEINDLEFDEQPKSKDLPRFSETNETIKAANVPMVQKEPEPNYTVLQPKKIRHFVIEEEPERNDRTARPPFDENLNATAVNNLMEEPEITRSLHQPKYEINDLEFEEQQERGDLPRFSEIDKNMKAATVPFVQEEPRPDYTDLQPRKIKDFVIEEEPERNGIAQKHLIKENVKASAVNNVQEEPEITRSLHQPKYEINDIEFDEQQERGNLLRFSEIDENMKPAAVVFVQEQPPEPDYTVLQPRKINYFVIEEEPERNGIARKPPTKENVKASALNNVQDEPDITWSLHQPKYEINDIEFEEHQERGDVPRFSEINENMKAATVPLVQEQPQPNDIVLQSKKIRDFVIDEDLERNDRTRGPPIDENVSVTAVNNLRDEPEITRSLHQPKYEINDLVFEEHPKGKDLPKCSDTDENMKAATVALVQEDPELDYTVQQPREIKDFVVQEQPDRNNRTDGPPFDEKVKVTSGAQEEPEITRSLHQPKYEIHDLEFEKQPERGNLPKFSESTNEIVEAPAVPFIQEEPEPNYTVLQPRKINGFVIEEEAEKTDRTQGPPLDENVVQEGSEPIRSVYQPTFEIIQGFVLNEQPEADRKPVDTTKSTLMEKEPEIKHPVYQPELEIRDQTLKEQPENEPKPISLSSDDKVGAIAISTSQEEPEPNLLQGERNLPQQKYEIQDFVLDEYIVNKEKPKHAVTDEHTNVAEVLIVEKESEFIHEIYHPKKIQEFVLEDELKRKDPPREPPSDDEEVMITAVRNGNEEPHIGLSLYKTKVKESKDPEYPVAGENNVTETPVEILHHAANETTSTEVPFADEESELQDTYTATQPTIIREFVLEEEPERKDKLQEPQSDTIANITALKLVEEEPEINRSVRQTKYEKDDFGLEQPESGTQLRYSEVDGKIKAVDAPLVQEEPELIPTAYQRRGEIRDFVVEEPSEIKDKPDIMTEDITESSLVPQEPEMQHSVRQPKFEITDFVLDEQPEGDNKPSYRVVEDSIKPTQTLTSQEKQSNFVLIEEPTEKGQQKQFISDKVDGHPVPLVKEEPDVALPKYGIEEFVLEEHTNSDTFLKSISERKIDTTDVYEEPEISPSLQQPRHEIRGFVFDDKPQNNIPNGKAESADTELIQLSQYPKYEIKNLVFENQSKDSLKQSPPKEKVSTTDVAFQEQEPGLVQYEVRDTKLDDLSGGEDEKNEVAVHEDSEPFEPKIQSRQQFRGFLLDDPIDDKPRQTTSNEFTGQGTDILSAKEQKQIKALQQQRYKLKDFVLIEEPEQYEKTVRHLNEEKIEINTVPLVEQELVSFQVDPYERRSVNVVENKDRTKQPNATIFVPLVKPAEQDEIIVDVDEMSEQIDQSSQGEETSIGDEPSRLDIEYTTDENSGNVGTDFRNKFRKMLSQRYEIQEKTTVAIKEESTQENKQLHPVDGQKEFDIIIVENMLELENGRTNGSGKSSTDNKHINIAMGTSNDDYEDDIMKNTPSYLDPQEKFSSITVTESDTVDQEIDQVNKKPSETVSIEFVDKSPKTTEKKVENETITERNQVLIEQEPDELNEEPSRIATSDDIFIVANAQEQIEKVEVRMLDFKTNTGGEQSQTTKNSVLISPPKTIGGITFDSHHDEQEMITTTTDEQKTLDAEMPSQLIKQSSLREVEIRTTTGIKTDKLKQETTHNGDIEFEVINNSSEQFSVDQRPSVQFQPVTIYPPSKPHGITIQLIDEISEPTKPKYDGTAVIEKLVVDEPGQFKKRTIHTRNNTSARSEYYESETTTADFEENVPEIAEQQFATEDEIPTFIIDAKPQLVKEAGLLKAIEDSQDATVYFVKETSVLDDPTFVSKTNVRKEFEKLDSDTINKKESEILHFAAGTSAAEKTTPRYLRQADSSLFITTQTVPVEQEIYQADEELERKATTDFVEYIPNEIEKRAVQNTENYESEIQIANSSQPPEIAQQGFTKEIDIPTITVDGKLQLVKETIFLNVVDKPEDAAIHFVEEPAASDNSRTVSTLKPAVFGYGEEDIYARVNKRELNIHGGKKETVQKQAKASGEYICIDHRPGATTIALFEKISPPHAEAGKFVIEEVEIQEDTRNNLLEETSQMIEQKLVREIDNQKSFKLQEISQNAEDVSRTEVKQNDEGVAWMTVRHSKKLFGTGDSKRNITLPIVNKLPSDDFSPTEDFDFDLFNEKARGENYNSRQITEQEENQKSSALEEISQSSEGVAPAGVKQHDEGVIWMTVRHSKKLFGTGDSKRIITLPIVNKLPSDDFSPTDNLDFELFNERYNEKEPGEHYNSRQITEQEEIPRGSRDLSDERFIEESLMLQETDEDVNHEFDSHNKSFKRKDATEGMGLTSSEIAKDFEEIVTDKKEIIGDDSEYLEAKTEVKELQFERAPDQSMTSESKISTEPWIAVKQSSTRSTSSSKDLSIHATASHSEIAENEDISQTLNEYPAEAVGTLPENDVWCTVRMKRWESDIRRENWSKHLKGKETVSELSSSTASVDGSYEIDGKSSTRTQSPNSEFSMKSESSSTDPWISIRKRKKDVKRSSSCGTREESTGYSMQITATDDGPLMTREDSSSTMDTQETEGTQSTNLGDVTTLPWIEVRKRDSIKQRLSVKKKKRNGTLKGVPHTTDGKDRLLLIKIPRSMLMRIENDEKMLDTEVEIPWMELDPSTDETQGYLPWVELSDQAQNTQTDRILMLKISRQMILKASKGSTSEESEIQLPWHDVVKYWEETGQITPGTLSRAEKARSTNIAITFPSESETDSQVLEENPNLPDMRLVLPKKWCLDGSMRFKPMITVNEKRNIKVRINKSVKRKHDWSTLVRLSKSEREKKYSHVTGQEDWVVLADGTKWWRLQIDDMDEFNKVRPRSDGQKFQNYFEISSEDTDGKESIDLNEFSKELGTKKQKQFSFVIDPKNLLTSTMSF